MRSPILRLYASTLQMANDLVADVPCKRFAEQPWNEAKHPAWVLAHLSLASGMVLDHLRQRSGGYGGVPEAWAATCMPGSVCQGDRSLYAKKEELLSTLADAHGTLAATFETVPDELLASDFPVEEWRSLFPTLADAAVYVMAYHESYHLGQLTQWRHASGFG